MEHLKEFIQKAEQYCSYQERCHAEVRKKLNALGLKNNESEEIIVHLISQNFLNEERFAYIFSRSKFNQKKWGKERIKKELKSRQISDYLITKALNEIPDEEYENLFELLSEKQWEIIQEKNLLKKRKKFCDFLLRKGYESNRVYERMKELESRES
ncbi:MAG: regulatory protein RecX [Flavobacteriaceae bacterium]|jgi:regulatory protein|nr:regulatory protein RecX [Flavobacteriaceae bacterium]